jgi:hypothetical protein
MKQELEQGRTIQAVTEFRALDKMRCECAFDRGVYLRRIEMQVVRQAQLGGRSLFSNESLSMTTISSGLNMATFDGMLMYSTTAKGRRPS